MFVICSRNFSASIRINWYHSLAGRLIEWRQSINKLEWRLISSAFPDSSSIRGVSSIAKYPNANISFYWFFHSWNNFCMTEEFLETTNGRSCPAKPIYSFLQQIRLFWYLLCNLKQKHKAGARKTALGLKQEPLCPKQSYEIPIRSSPILLLKIWRRSRSRDSCEFIQKRECLAVLANLMGISWVSLFVFLSKHFPGRQIE